ncbi:MAG: peptide chain release factor-like protein [Dehalococcoidia bacterium]|nr:peptide chain release factor-like protein [Dehalococcoidia bacterium]
MPDYLALSDDELLARCEVDTFRASGPGGQKRNKTESAVRLRHTETGLQAQAFEHRSQHRNRELALHRLRAEIATTMRRPVDLLSYAPPAGLVAILPGRRDQLGASHPRFWAGAQALFDLFVACDCSVSATAVHLGLSTGQLSRLLTGEPELLRVANALRLARGMRPLRA